jgi:hypothetical protein
VPGTYTWRELAGLTLRRQFPSVRDRGQRAIIEALGRIGPIQSQVARAPFVSLAARLPGVKYADIVAAHESYDVVRGSNLRGTVHTSLGQQHPIIDAVTRRTMTNFWRRGLKLERVEVADVQATIEAYATGAWRTPEQLRAELVSWLEGHEGPAAIEAAGTGGQGRAMAHIHSAMIRRPAKGREWERQTPPVYRVASDVLQVGRSPWLGDVDAALVELTRIHLAAYGPANRRDIAWWSGEGLRNVEAALEALGDELTPRPGPDGQVYYDLAALAGRSHDPGLRLLPEYDSLVVGYDPKSRDRFLDPDHLQHFWLQANGSFSSALLADGRLVGSWKFTGAADERRVELRMFPDMPLVTADDLASCVDALDAALDLRISDVVVSTIDD